jgi:hypothetical protein
MSEKWAVHCQAYDRFAVVAGCLSEAVAEHWREFIDVSEALTEIGELSLNAVIGIINESVEIYRDSKTVV